MIAAYLVSAAALTFTLIAAISLARRHQIILTAASVACLLAVGLIFLNELGQPKPLRAEIWCRAAEATVIAYRLDETAGTIEIWLAPVDCPNRLYTLPYSKRAAEQLASGSASAKKGRAGGKLAMRSPFGVQSDDEPRFYAVPQPAPPPKDRQGAAQTFGMDP